MKLKFSLPHSWRATSQWSGLAAAKYCQTTSQWCCALQSHWMAHTQFCVPELFLQLVGDSQAWKTKLRNMLPVLPPDHVCKGPEPTLIIPTMPDLSLVCSLPSFQRCTAMPLLAKALSFPHLGFSSRKKDCTQFLLEVARKAMPLCYTT